MIWPEISFNPINLYRMPKLINEHDIYGMAELQIKQPLPMHSALAPATGVDLSYMSPNISTGVHETLADRGRRYGSFANHAHIAMNIKRQYATVPNFYLLKDDQRQALEVIADKIARILNGDPNYTDNWHDIQGYAKLVEDRLLNENKKSNLG